MARLYLNIIRYINYAIWILSYTFACLSPVIFGLLLIVTLALVPAIYSLIPPLLFSFFSWIVIIELFRASWKKQQWPKLKEADRKLEHKNDFYDHPITLLHDHLINPNTERDALWREFKGKLIKRLSKLHLPLPFYMSAGKDPFGLRAVITICFLIMLSLNGLNETTARLQNIFIPSLSTAFTADGEVANLVSIEIQPPKYTGRNIKLIKGQGKIDAPLDIAEESLIKITVKDTWLPLKLYIDDQLIPLTKNTEDDTTQDNVFYTHSFSVGQAAEGKVHSITLKSLFLTRFKISYSLIDDLPPRLSIDDEFTIQNNGTLKFIANLEDDYGTSALDIFMDLPVDYEGETPLGKPYKEERSFLYEAGTHKDIAVFLNLTRHPYAGMGAQLTFNLRDGAGQLSDTVKIPLTLPERNFTEDVAKRIYALRKFIITEKLAYTDYIYDSLSGLSSDPQIQGKDILAKLAIAVARERIYHEQSLDVLYTLIDMLWRTALRLDNGDFMQSQQDLQDALNAFNKVLNDPNSSQDERLKAMQDLQNALADYFYEAQKEALRRMQNEDGNFMPQMAVPRPNSSALQDFLSQLESSALNDPEKAKELLNELEKALNSLNNNMQAELPQDIQQMIQFMQDMDNIIQQQNDLLDKSRLQLDYQSHIDALQHRQDLQSNKEDNTSADKAEEDSFSNLDNLFKSLDMPAPDIHDNQGQSSTVTQDTQSQNTPKSTMDVIMESGTQRHIQDQLHKMTDNMPMVPDELKEADKHMGNSATYLQYERLRDSISEQEKVLDALNNKRDQMQQAFEERLKQFAKDNNIQFSFDPLGRSNGDNGLARSLRAQEYDLPEKGRANYIDEILRELRSKAGDLERPKIEREYYERLLHQW
ncbi:MAG: DUF4175 domain-containing protein [Alphaproteobacteria bacterium]|nr:DUF4175 domain-containing protein [Alphaproteobacteria bacterium]